MLFTHLQLSCRPQDPSKEGPVVQLMLNHSCSVMAAAGLSELVFHLATVQNGFLTSFVKNKPPVNMEMGIF